MTTHEISIDLTHDEATDDHAYRAFCDCGWADPEGWHHAETETDWPAVTAIEHAHAQAVEAGDDHLDEAADEADPAPDLRRFLALTIPTTDQNGHAR